MPVARKALLGLFALFATITMASGPAAAQQQKPNILFIMGDDIGWMQPSIYHRGLMVGETPNIDRIGNEGAIFMLEILPCEIWSAQSTGAFDCLSTALARPATRL